MISTGLDRTVLALAAVTALVVAASCVSERSPTTEPTAGECAIPAALLADTTREIVAIRDFTFQPGTLQVREGTTVTWVNCEPEFADPHTSTSDEGAWASALLSQNDTFSYTFDRTGDHPYHCEPHPFMKGMVVVE